MANDPSAPIDTTTISLKDEFAYSKPGITYARTMEALDRFVENHGHEVWAITGAGAQRSVELNPLDNKQHKEWRALADANISASADLRQHIENVEHLLGEKPGKQFNKLAEDLEQKIQKKIQKEKEWENQGGMLPADARNEAVAVARKAGIAQPAQTAGDFLAAGLPGLSGRLALS